MKLFNKVSQVVVSTALLVSFPVFSQEVTVLSGPAEARAWMQANDWWGPFPAETAEPLQAPYEMLAGISKRWQKEAPALPVADKKAIFFRALLPLVLHANKMVRERRTRLEALAANPAAISAGDREWLMQMAGNLKIKESQPVADIIDEALYKLDELPPGLVLGQAAYESGYGTSRFAVDGNSFFGEWNFGDSAMKPKDQRSELGNYGIASFDWPFDSVRSYFINLSSHRAYEPLRRIRADLKAAGKPVTSLALAEGLVKYSERGQDYVDTLQGIIRVNKLYTADTAVLRDETMAFVLGVSSEGEAEEIRAEVATMRDNGELDKIIRQMQLD